MIQIAPSILAADFSKLGEQVLELEKYGADLLHIDIMDGMFVPNISFGIPILQSIRPLTKLTFDVHLMIEAPSRYIADFAKAGADMITVHFEADPHIDRTIQYIKELGLKAGVALNPATPVQNLKHLIPIVDMVLIMSVNPGFGGQKYIPYASEKLREVRQLADQWNKDLLIQVDGGVDQSNIKDIVAQGANVLVAGSAVFKGGNLEENLKTLRAKAKA